MTCVKEWDRCHAGLNTARTWNLSTQYAVGKHHLTSGHVDSGAKPQVSTYDLSVSLIRILLLLFHATAVTVAVSVGVVISPSWYVNRSCWDVQHAVWSAQRTVWCPKRWARWRCWVSEWVSVVWGVSGVWSQMLSIWRYILEQLIKPSRWHEHTHTHTLI